MKDPTSKQMIKAATNTIGSTVIRFNPLYVAADNKSANGCPVMFAAPITGGIEISTVATIPTATIINTVATTIIKTSDTTSLGILKFLRFALLLVTFFAAQL